MMFPLMLAATFLTSDTVVVRGPDGDRSLATVSTVTGEALRADATLIAVGGSVRVIGFGRWEIEWRGTTVGLVEGIPLASRRGITVTLSCPPLQKSGAFLLPLRLLADLLPLLGTGLSWDPAKRELRVAPLGPTVATVDGATPAFSRDTTAVQLMTEHALQPARRWTVVVDAGHGGVDPGMRGPIGGRFSLAEKDITLAVARLLARDLASRGTLVVMTRTRDTLIALSDRGRIANERQGNLFISIHVNAANPNWRDPRAARGFETYFLSEAKTEDDRRVAQMENAAERYESDASLPRDDALGFILSDMKQNQHLRESSELAETMQTRLSRIHPGPNRGVKQAGFRVLVTSFMPSVLVEIGFGTNPAEAAWISTPEGQRTIANAVADAAMEYLASYERRLNAGAAGSPTLRGKRE